MCNDYFRGLSIMGVLAVVNVVGLMGLCMGLTCVLWGPVSMVAAGPIGAVMCIGSFILYVVMRKSGALGSAPAGDGLATKLPVLRVLKPFVVLFGMLATLGAFFGGVSFESGVDINRAKIPLLASTESASVDEATGSANQRTPQVAAAMFWLGWLSTVGMLGTFGLYRLLFGKPGSTSLYGLLPNSKGSRTSTK